jgi:enoyl-CoA hydratase
VVLITGEGRAFCVGADLKEHKAGRTAFDRRQYLKGEQDVCSRLLHLKKPVIAAVNGFALGAGAEIAIASDFVLMAESAQIGLPEISIGNFLGGGVTWLLPRLVGLAKARELVFLGERIKGEEAVRIGWRTACSPTRASSTRRANSRARWRARRRSRWSWPRSSSTCRPSARSMPASPPSSRA